MGIIKAAISAAKSTFADQWLEVIEPQDMGATTVFTCGVKVQNKGRRASKSESQHVISNGSVVHVYPNQFMILTDGGKIVDYTAEEGYYTVDNSVSPSLFNGELDAALQDAFERVKFGGITPNAQRVYYMNLQEIKGIRFGTRNPINYFDSFYNAELFLRAHGIYSIQIKNPIRFFMEAIPRNAEHVDINDINEQYLSEFMEALQAAINRMSMDGVRISYVASKGTDLSKYMSTILDESWNTLRGMEISSVGIASLSYDDASMKLINMRNEGAMLQDASIREGYMSGAMARGLEAAGSNANGSMQGFMGIGVGMQMMQPQMHTNTDAKPSVPGWRCGCGAENTGKFCSSCGKPQSSGWTCSCGAKNDGKFCSSCGKAHVQACPHCNHSLQGYDSTPKFCPHCGKEISAS